jgi:hypothetical protein
MLEGLGVLFCYDPRDREEVVELRFHDETKLGEFRRSDRSFEIGHVIYGGLHF